MVMPWIAMVACAPGQVELKPERLEPAATPTIVPAAVLSVPTAILTPIVARTPVSSVADAQRKIANSPRRSAALSYHAEKAQAVLMECCQADSDLQPAETVCLSWTPTPVLCATTLAREAGEKRQAGKGLGWLVLCLALLTAGGMAFRVWRRAAQRRNILERERQLRDLEENQARQAAAGVQGRHQYAEDRTGKRQAEEIGLADSHLPAVAEPETRLEPIAQTTVGRVESGKPTKLRKRSVKVLEAKPEATVNAAKPRKKAALKAAKPAVKTVRLKKGVRRTTAARRTVKARSMGRER